jgi:hypothetical protein
LAAPSFQDGNGSAANTVDAQARRDAATIACREEDVDMVTLESGDRQRDDGMTRFGDSRDYGPSSTTSSRNICKKKKTKSGK